MHLKSRFSPALKIFLSSLLLLSFSPAHADLTEGLVAYWSFDDCTAEDVSTEHKWNGNIVGAPECTEGRSGKALNFNGTSDRIDVPNFSLNYSQLSISAYVRLSGGTIYQEIIGVSNRGSDNGFQLQMTSSNDTLLFDAATNYESRLTAGGFTLNEWHHIVGTWDGVTSKIYLDGKLAAERETPIHSNSITGETLRIGSEMDGLSTFWGGEIDELRIYNRALSDSEVTDLYELRS